METTPMRRLPQDKIWATIESMQGDLAMAIKELNAAPYQQDPPGYVASLTKIRVITEELLRWLLL